MGNRITFDESASNSVASIEKRSAASKTKSKMIAHILSVTDNSRVSLVTSVKRPPMVSYALNLFTVHKMLYCIIVKVKLAI